MTRRMTRRGFLRTSASSAGVVLLAGSASAKAFKANRKANVALIGVGGRGTWFVRTMPKLSNVVAWCDVSDKKATIALRELPKVERFWDYREMLAKLEGKVDGVVIATPDHHHAPAAAAAMKHGMGVFVEKPMARLPGEARIMRDLARQEKVATSMGNQGTASGAYRRSVELIQDGALGEIKEAYFWNGGGGPGWTKGPEGTAKVPPYLKWDLWLGPAAERAFHPKWMAWHGWREFGTGQLGNWASHSANLAFRALKIDTLWQADEKKPHPILTVQAKVDAINRLSLPKWEEIRYDVPARGDLKPIAVEWLNGGRAPGVLRGRIEKHLGAKLDWTSDDGDGWKDHAGTLIVGTEGKLKSNGHNTQYWLMPEKKFKDTPRDPQHSPRSRGHERDWLLAMAGAEPAWANFDYAGPFEEFLMLGNVATQFEGPLKYDTAAGKIINNAEADKVMRGTHRKGWEV